jgi:signal transduction histidine kinase
VLIALYTTAAVCELPVSLGALALTAATAATLSALTVDAPGRQSSATSGAIIAAGLTIGIWALGAYVQTRRRYLRELQERAAFAEREREQLSRIAVHEERASIARELHDIVAHSVSVMLVGVRGARDVLRTSPDAADDTLRLEVIGEPMPLPSGVELSIYRIVQEALTNTLKHSNPSNVTVTLAFRDARLELEVVDDGTPTTVGAPTSGQGLIGMRERVALLGGELETGRRKGGGFRVAAQLPVGGDA